MNNISTSSGLKKIHIRRNVNSEKKEILYMKLVLSFWFAKNESRSGLQNKKLSCVVFNFEVNSKKNGPSFNQSEA